MKTQAQCSMCCVVVSHSVVPYSLGPHGLQPRQEYWSGLPCPPPGDFPNPGIKPRSQHCRWILYHLSQQGSPRILEWVTCLFSRGSSRPKNQTGVSCIAGRYFTSWATREAKSLIRFMIFSIFLLICDLFLYFYFSVSQGIEVFNFEEVQFISVSFQDHAVNLSKKSPPNRRKNIFLCYISF